MENVNESISASARRLSRRALLGANASCESAPCSDGSCLLSPRHSSDGSLGRADPRRGAEGRLPSGRATREHSEHVRDDRLRSHGGPNYSPSIVPTAASTTDIQFSGSYITTSVTDSTGAGLVFGTLNDLDGTQSLTVLANTTAGSIALSSVANSTTGSSDSDLLYVASSGNLTIGGGSATLTLTTSVSGDFDTAGTLAISSPLSIGAGTTLAFTGNGTATVSGNIVATNGGVAINDGAGGVTFSGANSYASGTAVNSGTLTLVYTSQNNSKIAAASPLTLGGGTLKITGNASAFTQNVGGLILSASSASAINDSSGDTTLALGAITRNAGATVNFTVAGGSGHVSTSAGNSNGILGGWATVAGTDWATNSGGNIAALGTYASTWASGNNTLVSSSNLNGATTNSVRFNAAAALSVSMPSLVTAVIQSGGILVTPAVGGNATAINNGKITSGNGSDLIVQQFDTSAVLTIKSAIVDNGSIPIGLTKTGGGQLTLTGTLSFTGPLSVNAGTLLAESSDNGSLALPTTTIANGATLSLFSAYPVDIGSLAGAGTITFGTSSGEVVTGQNNTSTTFSGVVGSFVTLAKVGNGTMTLSGSNSASGNIPTILDGGSLILDYSTNVAPKTNSVGGLTICAGTVTIIPNSTAASLTVGGSVNLLGPLRQAPAVASIGGEATLQVANLPSTASIALGTLTRSQGTAIDFEVPAGFNGHLTTTTSNTNGILGGFATFNGTDWAANSAGTGMGNIVPYSAYSAFVGSNSSASGNYLLTGGGALNGSETMNSLKIADTGASQSLALGVNGLTISSASTVSGASGGGILYAGGASNSFTISGSGVLGATVLATSSELLLSVATGATLTVSAPIAGSTNWLTKAGGGTLLLSGNNTYHGSTNVIDGTLMMGSSTAIGNPGGNNMTVGPARASI